MNLTRRDTLKSLAACAAATAIPAAAATVCPSPLDKAAECAKGIVDAVLDAVDVFTKEYTRDHLHKPAIPSGDYSLTVFMPKGMPTGNIWSELHSRFPKAGEWITLVVDETSDAAHCLLEVMVTASPYSLSDMQNYPLWDYMDFRLNPQTRKWERAFASFSCMSGSRKLQLF